MTPEKKEHIVCAVRSPGSKVFRPVQFDAFVADLQEAPGVRVEVVRASTGSEE